jgi:hypothetical protein
MNFEDGFEGSSPDKAEKVVIQTKMAMLTFV